MVSASYARPSAPRWLILATTALTLIILLMAVAETTLWTHFLVDRGEYISLVGLGFALLVGIHLHRGGRLAASLPLMVPWLIYPVLTQADEIIDNLTINQMRVVCHLILAILFGAPIAVLVLAARHFLGSPAGIAPRKRPWTMALPGLRLIEQGRAREGACLLSLALLLLEIWVANQYLGTLMVMTLIGMGLIILFYSARLEAITAGLAPPRRRISADRLVFMLFLAGVAASLGLYLGFKNRPGAYQGSPHYYHDPSQKDAHYPIERTSVPQGTCAPPDGAVAPVVQEILADDNEVLEALFHAYYLLDRNYNYAFHNALFLRNTPVVPEFRLKALGEIARARGLAAAADARLREIDVSLPGDRCLLALLEEVSDYVAFNLRRASLLEELSGRFDQTQAGLQHATHLYEGEGKALGEWLMKILDKHGASLRADGIRPLAEPFVRESQKVYDAYANRIVGF